MRCTLAEKVKLAPSEITKHYRDTILRRLKTKVEGVCSRHGFVVSDSVDILSISNGVVEMPGLNGAYLFDVKFTADVCNPALGSVVRAKVININKFGILAEVKGILEIIIAKTSVNIKSEVDLETVKIGDEVYVEVLGKKYELGDKRISIIGRIVTSSTSKGAKRAMSVVTPTNNKVLQPEDEGGEDDVEADAYPEEEEEEDEYDPDADLEAELEDEDLGGFDEEEDDNEDGKARPNTGKDFFESDEEGDFELYDDEVEEEVGEEEDGEEAEYD